MAKILLYDLETSANEMRGFGHYDVSPIAVTRPSELLSVAWKTLGEKTVHSLARKDYRKIDGDYGLAQAVYDEMMTADMIVAHNLKGFDHLMSNTRFIKHGIPAVPNVAVIDTLEIARKHFKFPGNSLGDLAKFLGVGAKGKTGGKELWNRCMDSDPEAFKEMRAYNQQDVVLLEKVFKKLISYAKGVPNLNLLDPKKRHGEQCPNPTCGSGNVQQRGYGATAKGRHRRMQCKECSGWFTAAVAKTPKLKLVKKVAA